MSDRKSTRWALLERFDIRNTRGELYLRRWIIFECPLFGIYLHNILLPDDDRHLHDHPWPFASIVLRGYYIEELPGNSWGRLVQRLNCKRSTDAHRIRLVGSARCWTLVLRGRKCREWGFHTEGGWVEADEYQRRLERGAA